VRAGTQSVSCDLRVFVDDAAYEITSAGPESVEGGDGLGQRRERRSLSDGSVRPVLVMVGLVLPQDVQEVLLVPDESAVKEFPAASASPSLHDRVRPGSLHRAGDNADPRTPEDRVECRDELGIALPDQESDLLGRGRAGSC
jgi:hypothetical protein